MIFRDRKDAGQKMALALIKTHGNIDVVLGLPRGGVVCAKEIAKLYNAPLGMIFTRKIRHPHSPEYAIGAIAENNILIKRCESALVDEGWLENEINLQKNELLRQRRLYLVNRTTPVLKNKIVVVVDDGLATGVTMEAALSHLESHSPKSIIMAVPVASPNYLQKIKPKLEYCLVLHEAESFYSVGGFYENFSETKDEEIIKILA